MDKKEKHIDKLLGEIDNKNHKKDLEKYISIRIEVDKVNSNTLSIDVTAIHHLSKFLKDKPFQKATKDDMRKWSAYLKNSLSASSIESYQMKIKRFYKFIAEPDKYENGKADQKDIKFPDCVRWITYSNTYDDLPLDAIPTDEEIKQILEACKDAREQTIVCSLIDGGLRDSELRLMKIKNVHFDKQLGAYFLLPKKDRGQLKKNGLKTGSRKIQLFIIPSSTAIIKDYLNHHPLKNNPEAPFIITANTRITAPVFRKLKDGTITQGDVDKLAVSENGFNQILTSIEKRSGCKYHIYPHFLRHISATRCAEKSFNEPMLRERFGWSKSSKMPSRYVHLTGKNIDNHIKRELGIVDEETEKNNSVLQPIVCWNCGRENPCTTSYCGLR
jgi:integrase